ncbi:MAG: ArsA-related P-loop ATPase [Solirubrobacteraceae bacterium]|nr:ArsA-related P-loop ATPase [Patulibacter sp.]
MTFRSGPDSPTHVPVPATLPTTPLVMVTGKGGVGRSSTATAVAVALAGLGRDVALVHPLDAPHVPPPADTPADLHIIPLDRERVLRHYIGDQMPGPLAAALNASRAFRLIAAATPGLAELLTIGELKRLTERHDHIVFDAPATGHLLAMLDSPGRFERAAVAGPVARRAKELGDWIVDPAMSSMIAVTTGDGLAVSELLDLLDLLELRMPGGPSLVVANRLAPASPSSGELDRLADGAGDDPLVGAITKLAGRARSERAQLGRITKHVGVAPLRALERPGHAVLSIAAALRGETPPAPDPDAHEPELAVPERRTVTAGTAVERRRAERRLADRRAGGDRYGDVS